MAIVSIRCVEEENDIRISFSYGGQQKNMQRAKTEQLKKSLARISLSANQKSRKKDKKAGKGNKDISIPSASLTFEGSLLDEDLPNVEAWKDGSVLIIGEEQFSVLVNPPTVLSLFLPSHIMVDFPVYPVIKLEFAELKYCMFEWFRSENPEPSAASLPSVTECAWEEVGTEFCYKPCLQDIGCYLKLVCTPSRQDPTNGLKAETVSPIRVAAEPGRCPFENRHLYTLKKLEPGHIRCVSYNILADAYAREEFALNVLYPYCPPYALDIGYRKQVLMKELIGYNADIICLQECGQKLFDGFLLPCMELEGYQGIIKCKAGEIPEGEAIFFNRDKFELIKTCDVVLRESLLSHLSQEEILQHISPIPALFESLIKRNAIAQVAVLKCKGNNDNSPLICVVNTHLYYRPHSPHIRMLQAAIILNHTKAVVHELTSERDDNIDVAVLFCGDFNSTPHTGLFQLLTKGHVARTHHDWLVHEDVDQHCNTLDLSHGFSFVNACGTPLFTNYTHGFKDTLDYIFCDSKFFEVQSVVPLPEEEELRNHLALPSVVMPSDHLALVCDLKCKF
ncbi:predicted protein [Nematostella vectensis]|uniref:2',5'-phosphodiesterase 12 n=1 Tax=Nematostella vectensis TaxID=45351 RepID=A7RRK8_NEMVE|nr:predicted protein [Nematostella vectensis]|eukprot:XP_001637908.1 predicted protein [Nematostella vectensis]